MSARILTGRYYCPIRIGDIILTDTAVSPAVTYPETVWELTCTGRMPVGFSNETEFNDVNKIGGEKMHVLSTNEIPAHAHGTLNWAGSSTPGQNNGRLYYGQKGSSGAPLSTLNNGGGAGHNNLPPYQTKFFWLRKS